MPWWLWAVLALVLVALVWFAVTYFGNEADERGNAGEVSVGAAGLPAIAPLALSIAPAHPISTR